MDHARFLERKQDYLNAVERLREACAKPDSSFIRDSVIQRFKFCWELGWRLLQLKLQFLGEKAPHPFITWLEAANRGLVPAGHMWPCPL